MALSKHHFETFAQYVKRGLTIPYKPEFKEGYRAAMIDAANAFANMAQEENPRFDRARFMAACGLS